MPGRWSTVPGFESPARQFLLLPKVMPKPTKKLQMYEIQQLLAKASYMIPEDNTFEEGYIALQLARAMVCDLNNDIDGARLARRVAERIEAERKNGQQLTIAEATGRC